MTRSRAEDRLQVLLALRVSTRSLGANDLSTMLGIPAGQIDAHLGRLEADGQIRRDEPAVNDAPLWLGEPPSTPSEFRAALSARKRLAAAQAPCGSAANRRRSAAAPSTSPVRPTRPDAQPQIVLQRDPLIAAFFGESRQRSLRP